ncbi:hypothetical protein BD769DRAFT_1674598 [Suillus cothurnatus]|nr:hypothetical protein BD769DRAFT_1674598 [Suillus cothurnatus]
MHNFLPAAGSMTTSCHSSSSSYIVINFNIPDTHANRFETVPVPHTNPVPPRIAASAATDPKPQTKRLQEDRPPQTKVLGTPKDAPTQNKAHITAYAKSDIKQVKDIHANLSELWHLPNIPCVGSKRERLLTQMATLMSPQVLSTDSPGSSSAPAQSEAPTNIDDAASYTPPHHILPPAYPNCAFSIHSSTSRRQTGPSRPSGTFSQAVPNHNLQHPSSCPPQNTNPIEAVNAHGWNIVQVLGTKETEVMKEIAHGLIDSGIELMQCSSRSPLRAPNLARAATQFDPVLNE